MRQQQTFAIKPIHRAISFAIVCGVSQAAWAQQADKKDGDALKLEEVVVTATATARSKMSQSNSISTLDLEDIIKAAPTSGAEVLRSIPGIRSESSGGESNANVTVRGVPLSAGGARYVQFQEDGLPILQFGDIAFATPDSFLRVDNMLDRLEVVRGGSASTMATNSPGGIINFISKTGEVEGGSIGISKGVNFDQTRYDFDYGGRINDSMRFQVGGFYRQGEGFRASGNLPLEEGGQIRGNVTKELSNGFIRFNFKALDDQAPTNLPVPVNVVNGNVQTINGIDPRKASLYSPFWINDSTLDKNNNRTNTNVNSGFTAKSNSIGFESMLNLGNNWSLSEKFKRAENSGRFVGIFPPGYANAAAGATFATGPQAGQSYTGQVIDAKIFNTSLDNFDITANEIKLSKQSSLGEMGKLTSTFGNYYSSQNVGMTWNFNSYALEMKGDAPALINNGGGGFAGQSPALTATSTGRLDGNGNFVNGSATFGGCCTRNYDATYVTNANFLNLGWEVGSWNVDGSVRRDDLRATGTYSQAGPEGFSSQDKVYNVSDAQGNAVFVANQDSGSLKKGDDTTSATTNGIANDRKTQKFSGTKAINYRNNDTSYSLGANYRLDKNTAFFGRYSEGVVFRADRALFGGPVDGRVPVGQHQVKQLEGGVKYKSGGFSTFITLFNAKTDEASDFEVTSQSFKQSSYEANGVEFESAYRTGNFRVTGGLTYTDAEITATGDGKNVGNRPRRQAKFIYQFNPAYVMGDVTVGAAMVGTTKSFGDDANTTTMDGYVIVNPYISYRLSNNATASLIANNVFDKIAYTEIENNQAARALNGRTIRATLNYKF